MAAVEAAQSTGPEQVRWAILLARGAVELAATLELLSPPAIQTWRDRLDASWPRPPDEENRGDHQDGAHDGVASSGGRYKVSHVVRTVPALTDVHIGAVHGFERALVLDWFQRADAADTSDHDLVRDCRATDARGNRFARVGGQWSRPSALAPYGTTILLGSERPSWPVRLELGAARTDVTLHLADAD